MNHILKPTRTIIKFYNKSSSYKTSATLLDVIISNKLSSVENFVMKIYEYKRQHKRFDKEYIILEKIGISNNFNNFKIYYKTKQIYFHNQYNFLAMYINFFLSLL